MVPALNEEGNLEYTINNIQQGAKNNIEDYEILVFNDGSTDKTGKIANKLAQKNKKILVTHHRINKGLGYCYRDGLRKARFEYYMYIPGDDQFPKEALAKMLKKIGTADIVIPYVTNMHIRPILRQWLSHTFTFLINTFFNLTVIHRTDLLRPVPLTTSGFAYQAEALVRLLKSGASFTEVGYEMVERKTGLTSAFRIKNIKSVAELLLKLFWEIQICRKSVLLNTPLNTHPAPSRSATTFDL